MTLLYDNSTHGRKLSEVSAHGGVGHLEVTCTIFTVLLTVCASSLCRHHTELCRLLQLVYNNHLSLPRQPHHSFRDLLVGVTGRDDEATSLARVLILSNESRHHHKVNLSSYSSDLRSQFWQNCPPIRSVLAIYWERAGMRKPSAVAAYRTLGAFFRPVRDSDRPALPIVHALDESFRGKLASVEYPCLYCAKVCTSPQALATHGR
jgi:hypothetical protein